MKTAEELYPELNTIATPIYEAVCNKLNAIKVNQIETTMPYIRQCVLEMVIAKLERHV